MARLVKSTSIKSVSKKDIIKAIKTGPLVSGTFIKMYNVANEYSKASDVACETCAVGAVLRLKGSTVRYIIEYGRCLGSPYMMKLSSKFEELARQHEMPTVRKKLIAFVKEHFPERVKL